MERRGLCSTCVKFEGCIFSRNLPVWECEEFFNGNHSSKKTAPKVTKAVFCEASTESE